MLYINWWCPWWWNWEKIRNIFCIMDITTLICVMSYIHIGTRFNLPHMFVQWVVCNFKLAINAIIYICLCWGYWSQSRVIKYLATSLTWCRWWFVTYMVCNVRISMIWMILLELRSLIRVQNDTLSIGVKWINLM